MNKEQRTKHLKKLARSNEGEALKEHFEELIKKLTDGRGYSVEDFEMEGKASIKAAAILERIIKDLNLLTREKKNRERNPYV